MHKISAKHYILFIFGVTFISFKTYSSLFISLGGRDTWICTAIAYLVLAIFAIYLIRVISTSGYYDIHEIFTIGLSKFLGNCFLFLFALGLFLSSLESVAVEANVIKINYFTNTPLWYIIIFFLLPSIFLLHKNFRTVVLFVIISVSLFLLNMVILTLLTERYKSIEYLLPVLSGGLNFNFLYCTLTILGSLSSFMISLPYLKYVTKNKTIQKHNFIALSIIFIICVYSMIGVISTFGPQRASNLFYPEFIQSQLVHIGGFIDFGELFFIFQTVPGFFIKYILCSYGIYILYEKQIKNRTVYVIIYTFATFIASNFLAQNNYVLFYLLKYYQLINLVLFILVPLIAFLFFQIRKPIRKSKNP